MAHRPHLRRDRTASAAPRRHRAARLVPALAVLLLTASAVGACSGVVDGGGGSGGSGGSGDTAADAGGGGDGGAGGPAVDTDSGTDSGTGSEALGDREAPTTAKRVSRAAPMTRQVIISGEVTLQDADVAGLRAEVDRLVQRHGGYVSSERTFTDDAGRLVEDRLVLRVPSDRYHRVLAGFAEVATVLAPATETEDVTTEVIDVDARVRTAEVSLDRLRSFLRRSTDVDALVRLESEMAEREADLASLRAQQDYLQDQTSLATLQVTLQRPPEDEPGDEAAGGFLAGLAGGWAALTGVLVVALTVLGAVIPFLVVAAVVAVPVLLAVRAARRRRPLEPPPAT